MIYLELLWSFIQVGLFSIGGGHAAIPLIKNQVVDLHAWLTMKELTDLITIAEMTPGPISINSATFVGIRIAGIGGAVIATLGCIIPSCIIVSFLALIYYRYKGFTTLESIMASLHPAVVALIAAAGLSILGQVAFQGKDMLLSNLSWVEICLFTVSLFLMRKYKWHPILVMSLSGVVSFGLSMIVGTI